MSHTQETLYDETKYTQTPLAAPHTSHEPPRPSAGPKCSACSDSDVSRQLEPCGLCEQVWYCSLDCKEKDWDNHRTTCRPFKAGYFDPCCYNQDITYVPRSTNAELLTTRGGLPRVDWYSYHNFFPSESVEERKALEDEFIAAIIEDDTHNNNTTSRELGELDDFIARLVCGGDDRNENADESSSSESPPTFAVGTVCMGSQVSNTNSSSGKQTRGFHDLSEVEGPVVDDNKETYDGAGECYCYTHRLCPREDRSTEKCRRCGESKCTDANCDSSCSCPFVYKKQTCGVQCDTGDDASDEGAYCHCDPARLPLLEGQQRARCDLCFGERC